MAYPQPTMIAGPVQGPASSGLGRPRTLGYSSAIRKRPPLNARADGWRTGRIAPGRLAQRPTARRGRGPWEDTDFSPDPVITDASHMLSNATVPYAIILKDYPGRFMDYPQRNMLIFVLKHGLSASNRFHGGASRGALATESHTRFSAFNLPAMNYFLHTMQEDPKDPSDSFVPESFTEAWSIFGVVRSEEGETDLREAYEETVSHERLLNVAVKGSILTYNVWGQNVRTGTRLFIIVKKVPSTGRYVLKSPQRDVKDVALTGQRARTSTPLQLVPWADHRYRNPPDSALVYEDEFGITRRGIAMYVGRVERPSLAADNTRNHLGAMNNVETALTMPELWIFADSE